MGEIGIDRDLPKQGTDAIGLPLGRAVDAGDIRSDISPDDLLRTLLGILYAQSGDAGQPSVIPLVDVFVDGLRKR